MKHNILLLLILLPIVVLAQVTTIECPYLMQLDTLKGAVISSDFWFNSEDDSTRKVVFTGTIDLDIYPIMISGGAGSDTFYVDVWGLKIKKRQGNVSTATGVGQLEIFAQDSTRLTFAAVDTLLHTWRLEEEFSHMNLWDGIRVKYRQNGSDLDTVKVWTNLKIPSGR